MAVRDLTAGEAAARLAVDFPGLTAAWLRRLEARGVVTPRRTRSGYRRYSPADLEQVRQALLTARAEAFAAAEARAAAEALAAAEAAAAQESPAPPVPPSPSSRRSAVPLSAQPIAATPTAAAAADASATSLSASASADPSASSSPPTREIPAPREAPTPALTPTPGSASLAAATASPSGPAPAAAFASALASAPAAEPAVRRADRRWPDAGFFAPDLGEVSLDRAGLAAAVRAELSWVDELVDYGLLPEGPVYGGADLLVARACADLAGLGFEPRHLRPVAASAAKVADLVSVVGGGSTGRTAGRDRAKAPAAGSAQAAAAAVRLHSTLVRAALLRG